jgi:metallo-beta-lactamase family protein
MKLSFLGATGTVTGSKYLVSHSDSDVLVDCGLFQGFKQLRLRNWQPLPVDVSRLKAVVLTHAHLDHSGALPLLVRQGFKGPVYCSRATAELCGILLPDAAHLQEEEARFANKRGYSKHAPALPLYTAADAEKALRQLRPLDFDHPIEILPAVFFRLVPAGHLLGAAMVFMEHHGARLVFSGDLGRPNDPILLPPKRVDHADVLVLESTYGNRRHGNEPPLAELARHLTATLSRGGVVIIPAFAVGRAQTLLHLIAKLKAAKTVPDVPIYLNSPMAIDATQIYHTFRKEHRLTVEECTAACRVAEYVNTVEASKALNTRRGPMIIVSASGMATGGRVLHHLKAFAPDPNNLVLFAGFQAGGTRGAAMVGGAESVKIHGQYIQVRAKVANLDSLSGHADYLEILDWLKALSGAPKAIYLTHGEPAAADEMRLHIREALGWDSIVPDYLQAVDVP